MAITKSQLAKNGVLVLALMAILITKPREPWQVRNLEDSLHESLESVPDHQYEGVRAVWVDLVVRAAGLYNLQLNDLLGLQNNLGHKDHLITGILTKKGRELMPFQDWVDLIRECLKANLGFSPDLLLQQRLRRTELPKRHHLIDHVQSVAVPSYIWLLLSCGNIWCGGRHGVFAEFLVVLVLPFCVEVLFWWRADKYKYVEVESENVDNDGHKGFDAKVRFKGKTVAAVVCTSSPDPDEVHLPLSSNEHDEAANWGPDYVVASICGCSSQWCTSSFAKDLYVTYYRNPHLLLGEGLLHHHKRVAGVLCLTQAACTMFVHGPAGRKALQH